MKKLRLSFTLLLVVAFITPAICGTAKEIKLNNDIAWVKVADTYRCSVIQAYLNAMNRLKQLAKGEKPGTWCVVLDADETIKSNVQFQADLQASGEDFSSWAWNNWCQRAEATALPGAKEFCARAKELGGKVIIITNRKHPPLKDSTVKNLNKLGIPYDACLFREGPYIRDRSKQMRRADVEAGDIKTLPADKKLPPLKILMRVGDQTHDLYDNKKLRFEDVKDRFGTDLVIIPNPMYGDWARRGVFVKATGTAAAEPQKQSPGTISWEEAMKKIGHDVVVEGRIVNVYAPERGLPKLNFNKPWWEGLTVVIFNKEKFGDLESKYSNKVVRVSGKVSTYTDRRGRETVQIKIDDPSKIQAVK